MIGLTTLKANRVKRHFAYVSRVYLPCRRLHGLTVRRAVLREAAHPALANQPRISEQANCGYRVTLGVRGWECLEVRGLGKRTAESSKHKAQKRDGGDSGKKARDGGGLGAVQGSGVLRAGDSGGL